MNQKRPIVFVFCSKPMLIVHHHPHLMEVPGQEDKPHLGSPHDHHLTITAKVHCDHLERDKDLLLLHRNLEIVTEFPKRVSMGNASFEQIGALLQSKLRELGAPVIWMKIEAHDEGAELIWEDAV